MKRLLLILAMIGLASLDDAFSQQYNSAGERQAIQEGQRNVALATAAYNNAFHFSTDAELIGKNAEALQLAQQHFNSYGPGLRPTSPAGPPLIRTEREMNHQSPRRETWGGGQLERSLGLRSKSHPALPVDV